MPALPDVHARADARGIPLPEVGVRGVAVLLTIQDPVERFGPLPATASLFASLAAERRGGHLSRFGEALDGLGGQLALADVSSVLQSLAQHFATDRAGLRFTFPLILSRAAPVSGARGDVRVDCAIEGQLEGARSLLFQEVTLSVQTLCPCSKEMAERGAHNQRCRITARVRSPSGVPFRELCELIETQGSAPLFPVLKRADEKLLTERAYDHPAFVEDVVRDLASALARRRDVEAYRVEAQSQESIHPHDAYAVAEKH